MENSLSYLSDWACSRLLQINKHYSNAIMPSQKIVQAHVCSCSYIIIFIQHINHIYIAICNPFYSIFGCLNEMNLNKSILMINIIMSSWMLLFPMSRQWLMVLYQIFKNSCIKNYHLQFNSELKIYVSIWRKLIQHKIGPKWCICIIFTNNQSFNQRPIITIALLYIICWLKHTDHIISVAISTVQRVREPVTWREKTCFMIYL